jgi:hypothetical protein
MPKHEYEHVFIQHLSNQDQPVAIPMDVAEALNAWGADSWEIVHMEAVWVWQTGENGSCWPETLRGYYVTFRREIGSVRGTAVAIAEERVPLGAI